MQDQTLSDCQQPVATSRMNKGFTLIELLVVVTIIGTLAAIAIPAYFNYVDKAKLTVAINTMKTIQKTLEAFNIDNGDFPEPPLDFSTGLDSLGRTVFPPMLLDSINNDFSSLDSYTLVGPDYTVTATARDSDLTVLTLTPENLTY